MSTFFSRESREQEAGGPRGRSGRPPRRPWEPPGRAAAPRYLRARGSREGGGAGAAPPRPPLATHRGERKQRQEEAG